ncbi:hypothetical protein JKP88DRAFT_350359 [Tribonema minus]|uniref:GRIP domain-containing protein n=1 Tax=Tribonema minus TaxID=303371 RepID=A0A835YNU9_9STRA|nr:hypothetical protein JKP88DRAFT_350359 [Tribonema minus]
MSEANSHTAAASAATPVAAASGDAQESTLAKYKRLLTLARRSIEENQRQIAERENLISQLRDELSQTQAAQRQSQPTDAEPLAVLRRVDHDGFTWLLLEHEDDDDDDETVLAWRKFESVDEVQAFARRPGAEPLVVPACSLSPEECEAIQAAADARVSQIREDFRKYRDAEVQMAYSGGGGKHRRPGGAGGSGGGAADAARIQELMEEVQNLQSELAEQDQMWRAAYEKQRAAIALPDDSNGSSGGGARCCCAAAVREAERLRRAGSEAEVAAQWRQRYEAASREKEDALAKLEMLAAAHRHSDGGGSGSANGTTMDPAAIAHAALEAKYSALKEEYRLYRRKAMAALQGGGAPSPSSAADGAAPRRSNSFAASAAGSSSGGGGAVDESKLPYLRNLLLKYLGTDDAIARANMERAMGVVLQFSSAERDELRARREREEAANTRAWLSGVTALLGSKGGT